MSSQIHACTHICTHKHVLHYNMSVCNLHPLLFTHKLMHKYLVLLLLSIECHLESLNVKYESMLLNVHVHPHQTYKQMALHTLTQPHTMTYCSRLQMSTRVLPTLVGSGQPQPPLSLFTTTRAHNSLFLPPLRENNSTKMLYSMQYNAIFTTA